GMAGPGFNACAQVPPHGVGGGYPAGAGIFYPIRASNVDALLDEGIMPTRERVDGHSESVRSKLTHLKLARGDIFVATAGGGGGVGDPLLRAPELVAADIAAEYLTTAHAREMYGVIIDSDGNVDAAATEQRRAEIKRHRIGSEPAKPLTAPPSTGIS